MCTLLQKLIFIVSIVVESYTFSYNKRRKAEKKLSNIIYLMKVKLKHSMKFYTSTMIETSEVILYKVLNLIAS